MKPIFNRAVGIVGTHYKPVIILILGIIVVGVVSLTASPRLNYTLGNIFFGQMPELYNINLAQFFFKQAAYPRLGQAPEFAHYQLSRTYFIEGFFRLAVTEAENEIKLYPENARTYYILGLTYGYMNKEEEAIVAFSKFIEAYPDSWAARNDMAWLQFRIGDIEGALATIEPVSGNVNPWVQNTYGTILLNLGRTAEAEAAFFNAKQNANLISGEYWGAAYPGNDPRIYDEGLNSMKESIDSNLELVTVPE